MYLVLLWIHLVRIIHPPPLQIVPLAPATGIHDAFFLFELGDGDLLPFARFRLIVLAFYLFCFFCLSPYLI
jgi:hypothetical protein